MGKKLDSVRNVARKGWEGQARDKQGRWASGGGSINADFPLPKSEPRIFMSGKEGVAIHSFESFREAVKKVATKQAEKPKERQYPNSETSLFWDYPDLDNASPQEKHKYQQQLQKETFKNAPAHIQKLHSLLLRDKQPELIQPEEDKSPRFSATKSGQNWKVHLDGFGTTSKRSPEAFMGVYHHEMGHGIDFMLSSPTSLGKGLPHSASELKPQFDGDAAKFTRKKYLDGYNKVEAASNKIAEQYIDDFKASKEYESTPEKRRTQRIEQIRSGVVDINLAMYDDIAGAMSKNKIGHGHNDEYWEKSNGLFRYTETAANMISFMASGHKELTEAVGAIAPSFYKDLDDTLKKRANG